MASIPRSQYYYQSTKDDSEIVALLQDLSGQHPTCGFRKLFAYLRRRGKEWNHKRVYRVYKLLKMNKKRRGKRRLPARVRQPLQQAATVNQSWSMDFMSDSLMGVRKFRTFNVMDDCTREALAIEIDTSLSFKRIIRALEGLIVQRGKPQVIRTDNGPEFTSKEFEWWCKEQEIEIQFIAPGRPMQNGYIERFNRVYREAILDAYLFTDIREVRALTKEWMEEYNQRRPHEALQNQTPSERKQQILSLT
jgi:putative transposase